MFWMHLLYLLVYVVVAGAAARILERFNQRTGFGWVHWLCMGLYLVVAWPIVVFDVVTGERTLH